VDDRISLAVENNAQWCDLVCRSHGMSTSWNDGFWGIAPAAVLSRGSNAATEGLARAAHQRTATWALLSLGQLRGS
jgi:hypothetical protein